jgi:RNA polymerase sigma-70 factor
MRQDVAVAPARLSEAFVAALPHGASNGAGELLEPLLDAALTRARAAWPTIDVPDTVFMRRLAQALPEDEPTAQALGRVHAEGLYLVTGYTEGRSAAVAALGALLEAEADRALSRLRLDDGARSEIKQRLRVHLLVAEPGKPLRIDAYRGTGELRGWISVCATRLALTALRASRAVSGDDELVELASRADDPEARHFKDVYGAAFRQGLAEALTSLSLRERRLLRLHFIDALTFDEIARLCRLSRTTAFRAVKEAQEQLLQRTRVVLGARLKVSAAEVDSILAGVRSQLEQAASVVRRGLGEEG